MEDLPAFAFAIPCATGSVRRIETHGQCHGRNAEGFRCRGCISLRRLLLALSMLVATGLRSQASFAANRILLPIEIVGADGTTVSRSVDVPGQHAVLVRSLWLQVHGLRFSQQASVQVNASPWIPLSNQTVTIAEPARSFGGIGVLGTLTMAVPLSSGCLTSGANTIRFRFNRTDGIASGYRVLALNFETADGRNVLPPEDFTEDSPESWAPPLRDAASVQIGQRLWQSAQLLASSLPGSPRIQAHCGDCHARDGRDLKYFNFSNESIIARSRFHGLSALEGQQIASYIRRLPFPNPGRPWNPPYQPGPGIDQQPVSNWAAGAGLAWVLEHDVDALPYLLRQYYAAANSPAPAPRAQNELRDLAASVTPDLFRPDGNLNTHQIPIALELPDWSQWLPQVHPKDAWGTAFTRSEFAALYAADSVENLHSGDNKSLRATLASAHQGQDLHPALISLEQWSKARRALLKRLSRREWTPELARRLYSTQQWQLVKTWELMQDFELEGRGREFFGPNADVRTWLTSVAAETAPTELHIPNGPNGIGGSAIANEYLNSAWYELQIVLNSGNHQHRDRSPVNWVYVIGDFKELYSQRHSPEPARLLVAITKAMQSADPHLGPEDLSRGWRPDQNIDPRIMVSPAWDPLFRTLPVNLRRAITSSLLTAWMDKTQQYSIAEYLPLGLPNTYNLDHSYSEISGGRVWQAAQQFHDAGVSDDLLQRVREYGTAFTDRAARIHYE